MTDIILILARADNGVIGRDGALPWRLPADLKRFKALTLGHPMGRKTFDSLPGLLPGRRHIVLTRDRAWTGTGAEAEVAHDVDGALALADAPTVMVIGGAEIYRLFLPRAHRIELTEVHLEADGDASIAYPDPADWVEVARDHHPALDGRSAYSFVTLVKK